MRIKKSGLRALFCMVGLMVSMTTVTKASTKDSVGVKVKNGKIFVMHEVEPGQGLFSVSRRYNVPIKDIVAANPDMGDVLQKGQIILIPTGKDAPFEEQTVKEYFDNKDKESGDKPKNVETREVQSTFARYHTVTAGETLFSIAKEYHTEVAVIKDLNSLSSDALSVGQKLLVPVQEEAAKEQEQEQEDADSSEKERLSDLEAELERLRNRINGTGEATMGGDSVQSPEDAVIIEADPYERSIDKVSKYNVEEVKEKGEVQVFTGTSVDQVQRFASHHDAEIGTIIMVTNPATGQSVFVKVIKNHKLNDDKSNMIIITKAAAEKLNVADGSPVEISYAR